MTCRYVARDQPRILVGRHNEGCPGDECAGCQPCTETHCRVCKVAHHEHACPDCLDETRESLSEIQRLVESLALEAVVKGVDSEAMNLNGPAADWEALGHVTASVAAGRLPVDWIETADHELHPLIVLGGWESVYREAFEHDDTDVQTVVGAAGYLDRNLGYASTWPHVPFEDFARDLRRCRSHLERVLHDGEQRDTGAPCMDCRIPLVREWGRLPTTDGWRCPRCKEFRSDEQYRLNVAQVHRERAKWLTDREMQERTGIKAGTVREWARREMVTKRQREGRIVYLVEDVERVAKEKGMMSA